MYSITTDDCLQTEEISFYCFKGFLLLKLLNAMCVPGVPPGVVNMVFGLGSRAGEALVAHPKVHLISFTGGTVTAQRIRQVASRHCKKLSLEVWSECVYV